MPNGPSERAVFISYRRQDTRHLAGRLYDRLRERFGPGRIFMDVGSIKPGVDFGQAIASAIDASDVMLALIGSGWTDARDPADRRRLDDPEDFVVLELRTALKSGIRVIPILVDGAPMPRARDLPPDLAPLARLNAVPVDHQTFDSDVKALLDVISDSASTGSADPSIARRIRMRRPAVVVAAAALAVAMVGAAVLLPDRPAEQLADCVSFATDFGDAALDPRLKRSNDTGGNDTFEVPGAHQLVVRAPVGADARVDKQGRVTAPFLSVPGNGDFVLETTLSADPTSSYQAAGLLLLGNQDNYVRLERGFGDFDAIAFEFAQNGTHIKLSGPFEGDPAPIRVVADKVSLRLTRKGDQVTASWREVGESAWQDLRNTAPLTGSVSAGITVLNTGLTTPPEGTDQEPFAVTFNDLTLTCDDTLN